jgi:hypothetical protein
MPMGSNDAPPGAGGVDVGGKAVAVGAAGCVTGTRAGTKIGGSVAVGGTAVALGNGVLEGEGVAVGLGVDVSAGVLV